LRVNEDIIVNSRLTETNQKKEGRKKSTRRVSLLPALFYVLFVPLLDGRFRAVLARQVQAVFEEVEQQQRADAVLSNGSGETLCE
jgi:hypothetical protein